MPASAPSTIRVSDLTQWSQVCSDVFVPLRCSSVERTFSGAIRTVSAPRAAVTWLSTSSVTVERTPASTSGFADPTLLLMLQLRGTSVVAQHGRQATLAPGSAVLYDPQDPYRLDFPVDDQELIVVAFDRRGTGVHADDLKHQMATALAASTPGVGSLLGLTSGVLHDSIGFPAGAVDLVSTLVGTMLGAVDPLLRDPQGALVQRAKDYIRGHLDDPDLSVDALAGAVFVSPRALFQAFARTGTTPKEWIRRERMTRAADLLTSTAHPVAHVAQAVGYLDATSFSRAFSREVGVSPAVHRRRETAA